MRQLMMTVMFVIYAMLPACSSDDGGGGSDTPISADPLSGSVGGQDWTFVRGATDSFLSDPDSFFASLHSADYEACGFGEPGDNYLIVSIPTAPGDYPFSLSQNMTFVVDEGGSPQNLISTSGHIVVDEVTAEVVRGGLYGVFDGGNEVNGRFEVTICSQ